VRLISVIRPSSERRTLADGGDTFRKCIIAQTTGVDNIDLDECRKRGIRVMNTRGVTKEVVAEHALTLV
jgi:lactate dehydrogenase-like 2-hydroxyacid dehydrogenase